MPKTSAAKTRKPGRSIERFLAANLRDPEFRHHFERRLASLRRPSHLEYVQHELLHGAFLVHSLLEIVGRSGEVGPKRSRLFVKYPKLRRVHERALAATWDLYQAVGALAADVGKGT
jgi:hypothetical protein